MKFKKFELNGRKCCFDVVLMIDDFCIIVKCCILKVVFDYIDGVVEGELLLSCVCQVFQDVEFYLGIFKFVFDVDMSIEIFGGFFVLLFGIVFIGFMRFMQIEGEVVGVGVVVVVGILFMFFMFGMIFIEGV